MGETAPDLFDELRRDHEHITELLSELRGDPASDGPPPRRRRSLAQRLVIAESKHEVVEEAFFWPAVRRLLDAGLAREGVDQETVGKRLLCELDRTRAGNEDFATLVVQAESRIRQHIGFEETQVWPSLRLAMEPAEAARLGSAAAALRRWAPTRPHPLVPPLPGVLTTGGPVVGMLDRARDLLTLRG